MGSKTTTKIEIIEFSNLTCKTRAIFTRLKIQAKQDQTFIKARLKTSIVPIEVNC